MILVKHPVHGNRQVQESEVATLVANGWVKWPRSKDEKALGDGSAAGYWRAKYERDIASSKVDLDQIDRVDDDLDLDQKEAAPAKKRGRPFKV